MDQLKSHTLHEKLAYFYCPYVREETVDPEIDREAIRKWDKIKISRRKSRERICYLLNQIENVSTAQVQHLDDAYKAKRELILLAEGTIGFVPSPSFTSSSGRSGNQQVLAQVEAARVNNNYLQECGALSAFADNLQRSLHGFRSLNFQSIDVDAFDTKVHELHQDMTLMYLLIVFNANQGNGMFDRHLFTLGTSSPSYTLVAIMDGLVQLNTLPGFPIKRLLMLFYEWFSAVLGDTAVMNSLKLLRKKHSSQIDKTVLSNELNGIQQCKSFKTYVDTATFDSQDPFVLEKRKFIGIRNNIHRKYQHRSHHELDVIVANEYDLVSASLDKLDDEWESRCEVIYQLFLPRMHDFTSFLSNIVILSCGSALNARDKKTFFTRSPSFTEPTHGYGGGDFGDGNMPENGGSDSHYWKWILREKSTVLDYASLLILLLFKQFRCSHVCKGEYVMHFFLDANLMTTLNKFMNKDLATYLQVSTRSDGSDEIKTGFYALENELRKSNVQSEDKQHEFAIQSTRTITSTLRILQKITKRKPNVIKNALCRSSSIVWLKRVVSLDIPIPRLYALKLVKSQARYLGQQWVRKYTCAHLLTSVYLYVRPELDDDWLRYEEDDPNTTSQSDSVERLMFGEMQAYHHKFYWDVLSTKPLHNGASIAVETNNELDTDFFDVHGGRLAKFFSDLKLEPAQFCAQYDKWLDQEKITADPNAFQAPLPIAF